MSPNIDVELEKANRIYLISFFFKNFRNKIGLSGVLSFAKGRNGDILEYG